MKEWMAAAGATYMAIWIGLGTFVFWSAGANAVFGAVCGGAFALAVMWCEAFRHLDD